MHKLFPFLPDGHHRIVGGALALYGGMNLWTDFKATTSVPWYEWGGDALTFAAGVALVF